MFNKALSLVLFGVLAMGAATVTYGTFYDQGFVASVAGVVGLGEDKKREGHDDD